MGHDPQLRVGQASDQAIEVKNRVDVAGPASGQIPGKAPTQGPSGSRVTYARQTTTTLPGQPQASRPRDLQAVQTSAARAAAHLIDHRHHPNYGLAGPARSATGL